MMIRRIAPAILCVGVSLVAHGSSLAQSQAREIVTIGHGVLNSKASILVLEIAVVGAGPTAQEAKARSTSKSEGLITDFKRFGVKPEDWERSLSVSRRPVPDEPKKLAFWATTTLVARLDDFSSAPEMMDRATVMEVASIRFHYEMTDPQVEYERALKRALADARFRAEALAAEGSVKLGALLGCEELTTPAPPPQGTAAPGSAEAEQDQRTELPFFQQIAELKMPVVTTIALVRARFAIVE